MRQDGEEDLPDTLSQALWNPTTPTLPIPVALHRFPPVGLNRRGPVAFVRHDRSLSADFCTLAKGRGWLNLSGLAKVNDASEEAPLFEAKLMIGLSL